jgi:hypothetical protein
VVSQGNTILVTWRTDLLSKGNGVWYSYKQVDTPELPVIELPSASNINTGNGDVSLSQNTPEAMVTVMPTAENNRTIEMPAKRPGQGSSVLSILIGSTLVLVLLSIVAIAVKGNRKK